MSLDWLPGLDLSTGTFTLPLWAVGIAAAVFVALIVIAVVRSGMSEFGNLAFRAGVITIAVVMGWIYVHRSGEFARAEERRGLEQRAADLVGRAIVPGSPIACLESTNTETVEGACERSVFANPETVAAATAYMAARLSLLADSHDYTSRRDQTYETQIAGLRRTVGADRYGLASQVLATRDGCTADACDAFGLVYDDKKLRANMRDRLFDITIARYAANWPTRPSRPLASSPPPSASATTSASSGGTGVAPGPNVQFPSSQSIPPVSIMNTEPERAAAAQDAPPPPTNTAPASATKRPAAQPKAAAKSAPGGANAPMSLTPKQ